MEVVLGFLIAALIALTGVGAGTITAPMLILFLHVPVPEAVGTALVYSAAVKLVVVPVQIWRRLVDWRTLGVMLITGIPGVVIGVFFFQKLVRGQGNTLWLYLALGLMIVLSSAWHIYRHFRPAARERSADRPRWLAAMMLPIGAEVGFSSSGAGALGTLALLGLTPLEVPRVVGTDLCFGLCLALIGGGLHLSQGGVDATLLTHLILGGVAGALVGTGIAPRIPARAMRLALSVWLLALGMQLCWQGVH
ncbi:MAG: sulfite exporter TauE/SafE family protein [Terracidiphilus sp.]